MYLGEILSVSPADTAKGMVFAGDDLFWILFWLIQTR